MVFIIVCLFVCLSVGLCLVFRMMSQKPMQRESPNLAGIQMLHDESRNPFISGSKGQNEGHKSQKSIAGVGHCTLVSACGKQTDMQTDKRV